MILGETTVSQALNQALHDAMRQDARIFLLGEEITSWGSGGGLYGVTNGLLDTFGPDRVRDIPISEEAIVAVAVGASCLGYRPVLDLNFSDFLLQAMNPIVNQAAKFRYVFNGQYDMPIVIRANTGVASGKGSQHSQSIETLFAHVPGLQVVLPSTPHNAYWLLRDALNCPNPTIFLEHKALYNLKGEVGPYPVNIGIAQIARQGKHATVVATQLMVHRACNVANRLSSIGIELEVIDVLTLHPLDLETIFRSVRRTKRVLVCHEAPLLYGFGAELSASIMEQCWESLDCPVLRVAGKRVPIPFAPILESQVIPSEKDIEDAISALLLVRDTC